MIAARGNSNSCGWIAGAGHTAVLQPSGRTDCDAGDVAAFAPKFETCSTDMRFTQDCKFPSAQIVPKARSQTVGGSLCQCLVSGGVAVRPIVRSVCPDPKFVGRQLQLQKAHDCSPPRAPRVLVQDFRRSRRTPPKAEPPTLIDVPVRAERWQAHRRLFTHAYYASSRQQFQREVMPVPAGAGNGDDCICRRCCGWRGGPEFGGHPVKARQGRQRCAHPLEWGRSGSPRLDTMAGAWTCMASVYAAFATRSPAALSWSTAAL